MKRKFNESNQILIATIFTSILTIVAATILLTKSDTLHEGSKPAIVPEITDSQYEEYRIEKAKEKNAEKMAYVVEKKKVEKQSQITASTRGGINATIKSQSKNYLEISMRNGNRLSVNQLQELLNNRWELVAVSDSRFGSLTYIFKRGSTL